MKNNLDVLDRCFALLIVADRGLLEKECHEGGKYSLVERDVQRKRFIKIINERKLWDTFTNVEKNIISDDIGSLSHEQFESSQWGYESIPPLLWAIDLYNIPTLTTAVCTTDFHHIIGTHRKTGQLSINCSMRSMEDIQRINNASLLWHWRAREGVGNKSFTCGDIQEKFVKLFGENFINDVIKTGTTLFGKTDIIIDGNIFNDIDKKTLGLLLRKTKWIHHAFEWLIGDVTWDSVSTDTI